MDGGVGDAEESRRFGGVTCRPGGVRGRGGFVGGVVGRWALVVELLFCCESSMGVEGVALVRKEKSSIAERGETRSCLPPRSGGRCPRGTEGAPAPTRSAPSPPLPAASPPAEPGGEGIRAASSPAEWRERGAGRPISGFGRPLLVADRGERLDRVAAGSARCVRRWLPRAGGALPAASPPAERGEMVSGRHLHRRMAGEGSGAADPGIRSADPGIRSATPCGRPGLLSWRRRGRTSVGVGGGQRGR